MEYYQEKGSFVGVGCVCRGVFSLHETESLARPNAAKKLNNHCYICQSVLIDN